VRERAAQLREAADLLDKAEAARDREAKSFAEQLFSSAELIVGSEALAELAPRFREGAPPRVTAPLKPVATDLPPQPVTVGDSEKDRPEPPKPKRGALSGLVKLDGKSFSGDYAVVTLEPLGKKRIAFPTARVIEQRNRQFAPRVLVVPTGSLVSFPNFDPTYHNVFSTSSTKPFDLGLYRSGETREILFDKEGTLRLACNLHANMSAFIVVSSAPHYRITDASGKFSFKNLEPGKYLVHAYSERSTQPISEEIEIKAGRNALELGVKADAPSGPLPDKFGVARGGSKS
jgi:plastocyanin